MGGLENGNFSLLYVVKIPLYRWVGGSKKPQTPLCNVKMALYEYLVSAELVSNLILNVNFLDFTYCKLKSKDLSVIGFLYLYIF